MMGQHFRSELLFYYFRIEDQVPENHLLRLIDRHIGQSWQLRRNPKQTKRVILNRKTQVITEGGRLTGSACALAKARKSSTRFSGPARQILNVVNPLPRCDQHWAPAVRNALHGHGPAPVQHVQADEHEGDRRKC
jgi:hypothetical protein